ncbi:mycothiol synthase [Actinopolymorpha cephalotaxi]|uniref:Mycothiol acetyltransferase n=1 Tax=Actinopolymorpha cephalotaxi TaxID=504797 RepID=A0A1I2XUU3_9ACTN|nr:mycothiol synthase [Actinopolymorpha cephalotaxi]
MGDPYGSGVGNSPGEIKITGRLSAAERATVDALVEAAAAEDGVRALDERATLLLGVPDATRHLLARSGGDAGDIVGYAHLDLPAVTTEDPTGETADGAPAQAATADLVVHPGHRGRGVGRALADALVAEAGPVPVQVWAHGPHPGAARLAAATGFTADRALAWMRRPLHGPGARPLPDIAPPAGVTIRAFEPGRDEQAWLAVNAAAFAAHPEQGRWTRADLDARTGAAWFDPAGFFVAERDGELVGFHWTKVHTGRIRGGEPGPAGEIYVLGVAPHAQGGGLAKALAVAGLAYLRDRGLATVMLYVEADNRAAVGLYERLGFTRAATDVMYHHEPAG